MAVYLERLVPAYALNENARWIIEGEFLPRDGGVSAALAMFKRVIRETKSVSYRVSKTDGDLDRIGACGDRGHRILASYMPGHEPFYAEGV